MLSIKKRQLNATMREDCARYLVLGKVGPTKVIFRELLQRKKQ